MRGSLFRSGCMGRAWLASAVFAVAVGAYSLNAQAQQHATEYFRPWQHPAFHTPANPDWTTPPDPAFQDTYPIVNGISTSDGFNDWIFYVSSTGNDNAPNNGNNPSQPLKTIAAAWLRLDAKRDTAGLGDGSERPVNARIRLMRGSVFSGQDLTPPQRFGGRGPTTPLVIEGWPYPGSGLPGSNLNRPIIKMRVDNQGRGLDPCWGMFGSANGPTENEWGGDIWVIGLEITSQSIGEGLPPGTAVIGQGAVPVAPKDAFTKAGSTGARYLFEDLYIHDVGAAFAFNGNDTGRPNDYISGVTVRRCVIERTWNRNLLPGKGDPQSSVSGGAFFSNVKYLLFEENFMDQIGWSHMMDHPLLEELPTAISGAGLAPKTVFSQALYIPAASERVLVRNNVIARPSHSGIQLRGNTQRAENNLILGAPIGISLGHAQNQGQPTFEYTCDNYPPGQCPCSDAPRPCDTTRKLPCAIYEYYWRGQCAYNVILNSSNIDQWQVDITYPGGVAYATTVAISRGVEPRGRGLTISRCRMTSRSNASYDHTDNSGPFINDENLCEQVRAGHVFRNLIANNDDGGEFIGGGIFIDDDMDSAPNPEWIASYQAIIHDNIVYNWRGAGADGTVALSIINSKTYNAPDGPRLVNGENFDVPQRPFCLTEGPDQAGLDVEGPLGASFRFVNNQFIQPTERRVAYSRWNPVTASPSGYSWQDNKYYSAMPSSNGFQLQRANFQPPDFRSPEPAGFDGVDGWKLATGGASSSDARLASVPAYPDPDRTLATYMEFELGIAPSMLVQDTVTQEFMQLCAQQRRGNWNAALTAGVVNQYMRDGFGLGQYGVELCPP
jgi:hypothetical protein